MKRPAPFNIIFTCNDMSDTAIFIAATDEELRSTNGLPGDLNSLRALPSETERVVHLEFLTDKPAPERLLNALNQGGVLISILPANGDAASSVTAGLMARLHEFICAYPNIGQFLLAGIQVDRLAPAAAFLQRAGFNVLLCGPDRARLEAVRYAADDIEVWGSGRAPRNERGGDRSGGERAERAERPERGERAENREERAPADPFEVLVDEVTKSRKRGHRVLLTSLKQRMRKRIRRFDETRLKDKDGRPMRKFKDFIVDAANRGLIQLIEKGNLSHVLLPDEEADTDVDDENDIAGAEERGSDSDDNDSTGGDPLLDTVDVVGGESEGAEDDESDESGEEGEEAEAEAGEQTPQAEQPLSPDDLDPSEIDEEAAPPPAEFLELLQEILKEPKTLDELVQALVAKQQSGELALKTRALRDHVQAAFNNELLEPVGNDKSPRYALVDDWRDILDYL